MTEPRRRPGNWPQRRCDPRALCRALYNGPHKRSLDDRERRFRSRHQSRSRQPLEPWQMGALPPNPRRDRPDSSSPGGGIALPNGTGLRPHLELGSHPIDRGRDGLPNRPPHQPRETPPSKAARLINIDAPRLLSGKTGIAIDEDVISRFSPNICLH